MERVFEYITTVRIIGWTYLRHLHLE
jgi:hypothetical protein